MDKVVIVGYGEIGQAIAKLEKTAKNDVKIRDPRLYKFAKFVKNVDRVHICIPYSKEFVKEVQGCIDRYGYATTIVHSSIPVGTMAQLDSRGILVHSPVIGVHPQLEKSLVTFKKALGGSEIDCMAVEHIFKGLWIDSYYIGPFEASELAKLLSTTYYGWNIAFAHKVKGLCDKYGLDFDKVYTRWNEEYNKGYTELGMDHVIRPVLQPPEGGIGGHCVYENAELLDEEGLSNVIIALGKKGK